MWFKDQRRWKVKRRVSERRIIWSKDASYQDINPQLKPVPSPPPPGSLPPPTKILNTKNDGGGGRGQEEPFTDNDHSDPGANWWELALRRVLWNQFLFSCRSTFEEDRSPSSKPLVTYVFRLWGLIFGNLTTQLLKLNSFVLSKNLGEILFSNLYILYKLSFKRYSVRN